MKPHRPQPKPSEAAQPALDWMRRAHAEDELLREIERQVRRKRQRRFVAAGALAAMVAIAGFEWRWAARHANAAPPLTAATLIAPERRVLADGSTVELKDDARITVKFTAAERRVTLEKGEAHFSVTKNAARPFIVVASGVAVRAVGTAFSVDLTPGKVEVLVTEGRVEVVEPSRGSDQPQALSQLVNAGGRCIVSMDGPPRTEAVSPAAMQAELAWRIPQLEFSRTPLSEVITLMNAQARASGHPRLVLADPKLGDLRLSGFLRADNTDGLLHLLESNFSLTAERREQEIVLRK